RLSDGVPGPAMRRELERDKRRAQVDGHYVDLDVSWKIGRASDASDVRDTEERIRDRRDVGRSHWRSRHKANRETKQERRMPSHFDLSCTFRSFRVAKGSVPPSRRTNVVERVSLGSTGPSVEDIRAKRLDCWERREAEMAEAIVAIVRDPKQIF